MPLINLWRNGHCFNMVHARFLARYKLLCQYTWPHFTGTIVDGVALIIRSVPLPGAEFTIGRKKVFIRSPRTVYELDEFRKVRLNELAILIQKTYRCYTKRKRFLTLRHSQLIIASYWRTWRVSCKRQKDHAAGFSNHSIRSTVFLFFAGTRKNTTRRVSETGTVGSTSDWKIFCAA